MLKGINKNVIVVNTDKGSKFEAVYFVLKKGAGTERGEILKEANRIINDSIVSKRGGKRRLRAVLLYSLWAVIGAIVSAGVCLMLLL